MRTGFKTLALISVLVAGPGAAPMLYAHDAGESDGSMMSRGGMMGMMDKDGMMNMERGKDGMMEGCPMMRGMRGDHTERPNEQWREKEPPGPEEKG